LRVKADGVFGPQQVLKDGIVFCRPDRGGAFGTMDDFEPLVPGTRESVREPALA